jgi:hypothetical protein
MVQSPAPSETIDLAVAGTQFGRMVDRISRSQRRIVVEERGSTVAAVISPEDLNRLNRLDARREDDLAVFDEIGVVFADATPEEIERETAGALAEVRAEPQANRDQ